MFDLLCRLFLIADMTIMIGMILYVLQKSQSTCVEHWLSGICTLILLLSWAIAVDALINEKEGENEKL